MRFNNKNAILPEPWVPDNRLRLEALENSTFGLTNKASVSTVQYSLDNGTTWTDLTTSSNITLNTGEKAYLRGKINGNLSSSDYTKFTMTGKIAAKGNIMYLHNYENIENNNLTYNYCFYYLFFDCSSLVEAPILSATTLTENCYRGMFYGCSQLLTAPELPSTTLAKYCYRSMFQNCSSLAESPILPAPILAQECYYNMFGDCTSLNKVTSYASNISANGCLTTWLSNVYATGDFYNLGGATYQRTTSGIPSGWTVHTSL